MTRVGWIARGVTAIVVACGVGLAKPARASTLAESATIPAPRPTPERDLTFLVGAGSLNSPGASGGALWTGLRLALGRHIALSTDLGYGLVGSAPSAQDRWWLIPSVALVIPAGSLRIDLGAGGGLGTSSGYPTWSKYAKGPFDPVWHDTVPIVRAHASIAKRLSRNVDGFARVEVASLLFAGTHDGTIDTLWISAWLGLEIGIL